MHVCSAGARGALASALAYDVLTGGCERYLTCALQAALPKEMMLTLHFKPDRPEAHVLPEPSPKPLTFCIVHVQL